MVAVKAAERYDTRARSCVVVPEDVDPASGADLSYHSSIKHSAHIRYVEPAKSFFIGMRRSIKQKRLFLCLVNLYHATLACFLW